MTLHAATMKNRLNLPSVVCGLGGTVKAQWKDHPKPNQDHRRDQVAFEPKWNH